MFIASGIIDYFVKRNSDVSLFLAMRQLSQTSPVVQ